MCEFTVDHSLRWRREDRAARWWAMARKLVLGLSLAFVCQAALAQAMYRIKPLGYLGGCTSSAPVVQGFNGAGQATGWACNAHGDTHAFLWKNDGTAMLDLGPDEVGSASYGLGINSSGLVTGQANDSTGYFAFLESGDGAPMTRIYDSLGGSYIQPNAINELGQLTGEATTADSIHAFLWKNDGSPLLDLSSPNVESYGNDINASGQVVGYAQMPGDTLYDAFVWKNDGTPMQDLGTLGGHTRSYASYINAAGQVVGASQIPGTKVSKYHTVFWRNDGTPLQDLGTLGGAQSYPEALNDSGQIAGNSYTHGNVHAFVWMNDGTRMKDLGTLGGTQSGAYDMNSSGQVAGQANLSGDAISHAFLWRNDGTKIQDLNTLIDPTDPLKPYVTLIYARYINDRSDILADGTDTRTGLEGLYLLQGTVLTLAPRSLAFGNQPINASSAAKSVTMMNTSAKVVVITNIALTGLAAGQFAATNNCGKSLSGHATCTIKVTFKPTTKGAKSAVLNVNGGGGGLRSVTLTGTGT